MNKSIEFFKQRLAGKNREIYVQSNGTVCIGRESEHKWLYRLYAPVTTEDILKAEEESKIQIPPQVNFFLSVMNGADLHHQLSICGIRKHLSRTLTIEVMYQPIDIIFEQNSIPRSLRAQGLFLIGGYSSDGSKALIGLDGTITRKNRTTWLEIQRWENIEMFLTSEIDRMESEETLSQNLKT